MSQAEDADEAEKKRLCHACITDAYLHVEVSNRNDIAECSYCGGRNPTFSIGELAGKCCELFETYYERTSSEAEGIDAIASNDPESGYEWERQGDPAQELISYFAGIGDDPAYDIRLVLEEQSRNIDEWDDEQDYSEDALYQEKDIFAANLLFRWLDFERSLRTEARLFNIAARELFEDIFAGITKHHTPTGKSIIVNVGPDTELTELYRARVFRPGPPIEEAFLRPDLNFGPPSSSDAKPGRMNARGISVFYGATAPTAALAEVRPPVGSRVVVARFKILRPLKLLAIKALESANAKGSKFDPDHLHRVERAKFLGHISALMSMPVMASDDGFEYIVTQAIAEYLANEAGLDLDGLLFPSVQTADNSLNVVLFHKAAKVKPWASLGKVESNSSMSGPDGPEEDYYVREIAEPGAERKVKGPPPWANDDRRPDTLEINISTLRVHVVTGVKFSTIDHPVMWHIDEQKKRKF